MNKKNKQQALGIIAQHIKDLSFENISSFPMSAEPQPQIDVQMKVDIEKNNKNYNISLITKIEAKLEKPLFILELNYSGVFVVEGFPENMLNPILYIECPRLLFPFARSIIASTVTEGGFPPLYLAPVNFAELYQQQQESKKQTLQ